MFRRKIIYREKWVGADELLEGIQPLLQRYWEQYWINVSNGLCPLCETHGCGSPHPAAQREVGFVLSPELTAKSSDDHTPYLINRFYTVCDLNVYEVRIKFTKRNLVSDVFHDCLNNLADSMVSGLKERIEQQFLQKLQVDIENENSNAISLEAPNTDLIFGKIREAAASFSELKFPESGRWIIINSSMKHALIETKKGSTSDYFKEALLRGTTPYYGFRFFELDTNRYSNSIKGILNDRLVLFHEKAVGCAYSRELAVKVYPSNSDPDHTFLDCELLFGTVTNEGAGIGQIVVKESVG